MARGRAKTPKKQGGSPKVFPDGLSVLVNVDGAVGWSGEWHASGSS